MTYNIFSSTAPAMPKPAKGTEIVKLLLSQVSREMREPLLPMTIPALAAHVSDVEFMYSDNKYHELCGQMGHLIGPSGIGKDQLHDLVEAIMRSTGRGRRTPGATTRTSRNALRWLSGFRPSMSPARHFCRMRWAWRNWAVARSI